MDAFEVISKNLDNLGKRIDGIKSLLCEIDKQFTELRDSLLILTPEEFEEVLEDAQQEKVDYKQQSEDYRNELEEVDKKLRERLRKVLSILDVE